MGFEIQQRSTLRRKAQALLQEILLGEQKQTQSKISYGSSIELSTDRTEGNVLKWTDPDNIAQSIGVLISLRSTVGAFAGANSPLPSVAVTVEFGSGGSSARSDIDLGVGVGFALIAEEISVTARYQGLGGLANPPSVVVAAQICDSARVFSRPPTLSLPLLAAIGLGGTQRFVIPGFARTVRPFLQFTGAGNIALNQENAIAVVLSETHYGASEPDKYEIITPDARTILLTNTSGAIINRGVLTFELGF